MPQLLLPARPGARGVRRVATAGLALVFLLGAAGAQADVRAAGSDATTESAQRDGDGRDGDGRDGDGRDGDGRDGDGADALRSDEVTPATTENRVPGVHVGVPEGTELETMGRSTVGLALHARESRTLDGQDIRDRVEASGKGVVLTIRNSRLRYSADDQHAARARNGARVIFEDSELDGMGEAGRAATMGQVDLLRT